MRPMGSVAGRPTHPSGRASSPYTVIATLGNLQRLFDRSQSLEDLARARLDLASG